MRRASRRATAVACCRKEPQRRWRRRPRGRVAGGRAGGPGGAHGAHRLRTITQFRSAPVLSGSINVDNCAGGWGRPVSKRVRVPACCRRSWLRYVRLLIFTGGAPRSRARPTPEPVPPPRRASRRTTRRAAPLLDVRQPRKILPLMFWSRANYSPNDFSSLVLRAGGARGSGGRGHRVSQTLSSVKRAAVRPSRWGGAARRGRGAARRGAGSGRSAQRGRVAWAAARCGGEQAARRRAGTHTTCKVKRLSAARAPEGAANQTARRE